MFNGHNWKARRVEMELLGKILNIKYLDGDNLKGNCLVHGVKEIPDTDEKEFCFCNSSKLNWRDESWVDSGGI